MKIFVVGLSHNTAPISVRDRLTISPEDLVFTLNEIKANKELSESCIISTCNRTELYGTLPDRSANDKNSHIFFKSMYSDLDIDVDEYLFYRAHEDAVKHLFEVSAGLDSLALGEPQIFGQVKTAYQAAANNRNTASIFNRLFNKTFSVTKRIRTETRIGQGTTSISFAAVELAQKIFGDFKPLRFLIIGAGETGALTANHFRERGASKMQIANRTFDKAEKLAAKVKVSAIKFDEIDAHLGQSDVIVSSTGAGTYTVNKAVVASVMKQRKNRPLFFIDLGAPRDIDPDIGSMYNVFLYNIDDLRVIVEANIAGRKNEVAAAMSIIKEEVADFFTWYSTIGVLPTIRKLQERFESIRKDEIEHNIGKLENADREKVDLLTKSIIKKLLKDPIMRLKELAQASDGLGEAEVLKKIFNLQDIPRDEKKD